MGGSVFILYPRAAFDKDVQPANGNTGFGGITPAHNTRNRGEVDGTLKQAEGAGAKILKPAQDVFWGGYSGCFADPDGCPWEAA